MVSTALIVTTLLGAVMVLPTGFCASAVGTTCGLNGICRAEADCAWARGKKNVEICGYTNTGRIVCCPGQRQSSVASTNPPQTHIEPRVGDLARRLCKHYVKYVMADEQALLNDTWSPELKAERCPNGLIPLISGGVEAKPQEYPHMALIGYGERDAVRYGCGGSLISTRFVLTAAHCSNTQNPAKWVLLGDLDFSRTDENSKPQMLAVKDQTFHDDYKPPAMYYDVLLLQLEGKVKMSNFVRPACLHTDTTWPDKNTTATGWGYQDHSSQMTTALQKVKLPVQPFRKCSEMFTASSLKVPHGLNKTIQLCAGDPSSPRKNVCKGDSGGPLQLFSRNAPLSCMHIVVGVTSIGVECGQVALSVFTRVSSPVILRWIEKTLKNANKNN